MPWIDEAEARKNEAGKRFLNVALVQVREASLSTKAKSKGKSDQGANYFFDGPQPGDKTRRTSRSIAFSFNALTLTPRAPILVYKRFAGVSVGGLVAPTAIQYIQRATGHLAGR